MYVRVVKNDLEGKGRTSETVDDCTEAKMEPAKEGYKFLTLDSGKKRLELFMAETEIYYMNNEGRTIDKYVATLNN